MAENKAKNTEAILADGSKESMSTEKKQNIIGLAIIGVVTVGLCLTGIFGGEDDIKASSPADSSVAESVTTTTTTTTTAATSALSGDTTTLQTSSVSDDATTTTTTTAASTGTTTTKEQETTTTTKKQNTTATTKKPETTTTTTTTQKPVGNGKLTASASVANSWESDEGYHAQISVTIENKTSSEIDGWTISIAVPDGSKVDQAWGCEATVSGSKLIIKPADYTKTLAPGQKIEDNIGIIVIAGGEFTPSVSVN